MISLSYGERGESGELWQQDGQTIENVKRIRHDEAERAATALGAEFRCLDLGDYPLELGKAELERLADEIRDFAPDVVVTHPEFPSQRIAIEDQLALADRGALMERAFTTPHTGKCTWEQIFAATRAVGAERTVFSTDLGQRDNPPVEDGIAALADRFLAAGFSEQEVRTMAVENTRRLAGI